MEKSAPIQKGKKLWKFDIFKILFLTFVTVYFGFQILAAALNLSYIAKFKTPENFEEIKTVFSSLKDEYARIFPEAYNREFKNSLRLLLISSIQLIYFSLIISFNLHAVVWKYFLPYALCKEQHIKTDNDKESEEKPSQEKVSVEQKSAYVSQLILVGILML